MATLIGGIILKAGIGAILKPVIPAFMGRRKEKVNIVLTQTI